MQKMLSSRLTPVYRWVIPTLLTFAAIATIWVFARLGSPEEAETTSVLLGVLIALGMVVIARWLDRAKKVWLEGDRIVVSDFSTEVRVALSDIAEVNATRFVKPDRVKLRLTKTTRFGDTVIFFPPCNWFRLLQPDPTADKLRELAKKARSSPPSAVETD